MDSRITLKHEDELILKCSNTYMDSNAKKKIELLLNKNLDWKYIQQMVLKHKLTPIFYFNIDQFRSSFPEEFFGTLKSFFDYNVRKNLFMWAELLNILKHLELNGVKAISYKGPALALLAYGNLALREFNDIDIYVDAKDVFKAKTLVSLLEYEIRPELSPQHNNQYIKYQREYKFKNQNNKLEVEIQWNVAGTSFSFPNNSVYPVNDPTEKCINNHIINSFSSEDLILILSIHAANHQWERLSWVNDICGLIRMSKDLNWDIIIEKAKSLRVERILYINIYLAKELFDLEIPIPLLRQLDRNKSLKKLARKIIRMIFNKRPPNVFTRIILRVKIRDHMLIGLKDIWRILTIPTSEEWKDFEKKENLRLNYIILRPIQILGRLKYL